MSMPLPPSILKIRQNLPLNLKIKYTEDRIRQWVEYFGVNEVYVSFSGGKDSTVLLNICRKLYPNIEAVFCDTGLEFPEIRTFVKTINNVTWIRPNIPFNQVLKKYGWPIVSKEQSRYIWDVKNSTEVMKKLRLTGEKKDGTIGKMGVLSKKWRYLVDAPFKINNTCCDVMKKRPFKKYEKETNRKPITGVMADESSLRKQKYNRYGCNAFSTKRPQSSPISFWKDKDVWEYIRKYNIPYSKIYDMGYKRTGCMFCLFGYHLELQKNIDRVGLLKKTHPKMYKYCMDKLGMREVLEWYPKRDNNV